MLISRSLTSHNKYIDSDMLAVIHAVISGVSPHILSDELTPTRNVSTKYFTIFKCL